MDAQSTIRGRFSRDEGVKGRALAGDGSVSWETGALEIRGRLSSPKIGLIAGCLGAVLGLALVVGATVALEDYDVDLMRYRKGPVLVAFLALIAVIAGYGWAAGAGEWLLGRRVAWTIPLKDVRAELWQENALKLSWDTDPPNKTVFWVEEHDAERLAELASVIKKARPPGADLPAREEPAKPSAAAPGDARFDVVFVRLVGSKIMAIKEVRDATGWGLAKAKDSVETPPQVLRSDLSETEARELASDLLKSNIEVILRPR
ncbi:MAG: ribosomal protein L7/L12 [Planctomycetota bacterium]